MASTRVSLLGGLSFLAVGLAAPTTRDTTSSCKVIPGDPGWPTANDWATLNSTISGRLIASVPLASVCHDDPFNNYNATACSNLQNTWDISEYSHISVPVEILNQNFQNYSCVPFTPESQACELGNYASYVVNVTEASDVQSALAFAEEHNLRIVIKNTGHDYTGKGTGKGALSLWTHNLQTVEYIASYNSSYWNGAAAHIGAGVEAWQMLELGKETNTRSVGGTCATVGIGGGFSLGGGHSILGSSYGAGADQILELEVVTPNGTYLVATPEENSDLYWALSGGGGGVFGVVLSMKIRLHPGGIVGSTLLSFNDSAVGNDAYWDAVGAFQALLPSFLDAGNSFSYAVGASSFTAFGTMPDANITEVNALLQPFLNDLESRGITPDNQPTVYDSFYDRFYAITGSPPYGMCAYDPFIASRIIPRSLVTNPDTNANVTQLFRDVTTDFEAFAPFYCDSFNVSTQAHPDNSLVESWRTGMLLCSPAAPFDWTATPEDMAARDQLAGLTLQPKMDAATPGGSAYLNEINHYYQDWKVGVYAENYDRLLSIKQQYDPDSLLYAVTGVGSDYYTTDSEGRLCPAS